MTSAGELAASIRQGVDMLPLDEIRGIRTRLDDVKATLAGVADGSAPERLGESVVHIEAAVVRAHAAAEGLADARERLLGYVSVVLGVGETGDTGTPRRRAIGPSRKSTPSESPSQETFAEYRKRLRFPTRDEAPYVTRYPLFVAESSDDDLGMPPGMSVEDTEIVCERNRVSPPAQNYPGRMRIRAPGKTMIEGETRRHVARRNGDGEGVPFPLPPHERTGSSAPDQIRVDTLPEDPAAITAAVKTLLAGYALDAMNRMTVEDPSHPGIRWFTNEAVAVGWRDGPFKRETLMRQLIGHPYCGITSVILNDHDSNIAARPRKHPDGTATPGGVETSGATAAIEAITSLGCKVVSVHPTLVDDTKIWGIEVVFVRPSAIEEEIAAGNTVTYRQGPTGYATMRPRV